MSLGSGRSPAGAGLPAPFMASGSSSFTEFLGSHAPELLPSGRPLPPGGALEAPHGTTIVTLTFDGGVVMAGDRRATMGNLIANRDMQKVFGADELLGRRHRRDGRPRDRAGQALPGRARALREDRGHAAVPGGQGQPPGHHDPQQPGHGHAGAGGRAALRRVRPRGRPRPHLLLRRHRWLLRGARPPQRGVGLAVRPRGAEEAVASGPRRRRRHPGGGRGAVRRRRRRLRHGRAGPRAADLADARGRRRPGAALRAGRPARRRGRADRRPDRRDNPGGAR